MITTFLHSISNHSISVAPSVITCQKIGAKVGFLVTPVYLYPVVSKNLSRESLGWNFREDDDNYYTQTGMFFRLMPLAHQQ
jgi:hypothetical protein